MKKAETPSLTYSPRNAWDVYTTATQKRQMDALVKRYMDFLSNCKTERETVAYVQKRLQEAGFSEDFKKNTVFRNLRGKAIFAARKGKIPLQKSPSSPSPTCCPIWPASKTARPWPKSLTAKS